jgi:hypothetical protein
MLKGRQGVCPPSAHRLAIACLGLRKGLSGRGVPGLNSRAGPGPGQGGRRVLTAEPASRRGGVGS